MKIECEEHDIKSPILSQVFDPRYKEEKSVVLNESTKLERKCDILKYQHITPREIKIEIEEHDIKSGLLSQVEDLCYVEEKPDILSYQNNIFEGQITLTQLQEEISQSKLAVKDFQDLKLNCNKVSSEIKVVLFREDLEEKKSILYKRSRIDVCTNPNIKQKHVEENVQLIPTKLNRLDRNNFGLGRESTDVILNIIKTDTEECAKCKYKRTQCKCEMKFDHFSCNICNFQTKYAQSLKRHILIHKDMDEVEHFSCKICAYKTKHRKNLKRHLLIHKDIKEVEHFSCSICGFKTKHRIYLKQHVLLHEDTKKSKHFSCDDCDFKTRYACNLKTHVLTHKDIGDVKHFSCNICSFKTKYVGNWKSHVLIHKDFEKVRNLSCDICDFKTKHLTSMKRHTLIHKDIEEVEHFSCEICDYKTKHHQHMKSHVLSHKGMEEIEHFSCNICGFKTKYTKSFKNHVLIHKEYDEVQNFYCDMCDYKTKHRAYLKKHSLIHKDIKGGKLSS